jgi:hypothetical protein
MASRSQLIKAIARKAGKASWAKGKAHFTKKRQAALAKARKAMRRKASERGALSASIESKKGIIKSRKSNLSPRSKPTSAKAAAARREMEQSATWMPGSTGFGKRGLKSFKK